MEKKCATAKRIFLAALSLIFCFCLIFSGCNANNTKQEGNLLRIHVRANSNEQSDQAVKMIVKQAVVAYLDPLIENAGDIAVALEIVSANKAELKEVCDETLYANGKNYRSRVTVCREYFPTRAYESVVVESGVYDALIIELGKGAGDNWWCVIYPPLCFVKSEEDGVRYKSRIAELWRRFISRSR